MTDLSPQATIDLVRAAQIATLLGMSVEEIRTGGTRGVASGRDDLLDDQAWQLLAAFTLISNLKTRTRLVILIEEIGLLETENPD